MADHAPNAADAERRAKTRLAMLLSGIVDFALAGFVLGWGHSVLGLEYQTAYLLAAVLAAIGVVTVFVATLALGRKGQGRALDDGEDAGGEDQNEPVVRR